MTSLPLTDKMYLPKIIDKLTPTGKVDPSADTQQGLAAVLPSLLQSLGGKPGGDQAAQALPRRAS